MRRMNDADDSQRKGPRADILDLLSAGEPPAFATDHELRVIFWNRGAERLLGRNAEAALGKRCFNLTEGRDTYGNRFCYEDCAVVSTTRRGEPVRGYELTLPSAPQKNQHVSVSILQIPGTRPGLFTLIHILEPFDPEGRLARELERLHATDADAPAARKSAPAATSTAPTPSAPAFETALRGEPPLTTREKEVLRWVAAGLQNKEIAQKLEISLATVRNHIRNILEKLEVHSKLEAVSLAFRNRWVEGGAAPAGVN